MVQSVYSIDMLVKLDGTFYVKFHVMRHFHLCLKRLVRLTPKELPFGLITYFVGSLGSILHCVLTRFLVESIMAQRMVLR